MLALSHKRSVGKAYCAGLFFILSCAFLHAQETIYGDNQPYASHWFVEDLLKWTPEDDKESAFNVSHIPRVERFLNDTVTIDTETKIPGIIALMAPYDTNGHPSQGFPSVEQYVFPYWQYIDHFVQWGGSAGEGIIVPPLATWTDAAHRNGVTSIGTVFFPPNVYGGKEEWVYEFLVQREDGSFPVADKLIEVAKTYNFDGWFINQETYDLEDSTAKKMIDFVRYYKENSKLMMVWYDAMINDSRVIWQDELNTHNEVFFQDSKRVMSDVFFINFRYSATNLEDSKKHANELGRSEWDLYAGIDVQSKSYKSLVKWDDLFHNNAPKNTSIGLYFSNSTFNISKTKQPEDVYESEQRFWNGGTEIETRFGTSKWQGFSKYFDPRSVINKLPFKTNFNYGLGRFYKEKGKQVSNREWHNISIQDILPTWQWKVDSLKVKPNIDFNESYEGGSCLFLESLNDAEIPLYKTNIGLHKPVKFEVIAKADSTVGLEFFCVLSTGDTLYFSLKKSNSWKKTSFTVSIKKGESIENIGVKTKGKGKAHIGEISMYNKKDKKLSAPEFTVNTFSTGSSTEIHLHFQKTSAVFHNVYAYQQNGQKIWLGKTPSKDYYINDVPLKNGCIELLVEPIGQDGTKGKSKLKRITLNQ